MTADAPSPSKRPFGYPLPTEALKYFSHPDPSHPLADPIRIGDQTFAGNGFSAIHIDSFIDPDALGAGTKKIQKRLTGLPWELFKATEGKEKKPKWKPLDDVAGILWKYGPKPIWERTRTRFHIRTQPTVTIGTGAVALFPLIQLAARLPRAEVWTYTKPDDHILIRFNGGTMILAHHEAYTAPRFTLFKPRRHFDGKVEW